MRLAPEQIQGTRRIARRLVGEQVRIRVFLWFPSSAWEPRQRKLCFPSA